MTLNLNVKNRNKGDRSDDSIPAVMYGAHAKSTPIFVNKIDFLKVFSKAGESAIVTLTGDSDENVLIQDVQMDPVSYTPIHADLYVIEKGQKVHVNLPLNFIGESPAVKAGGNLIKVIFELSVEGEPSKMPSHIDVDLSKLVDMNSNILVKDLDLPKGSELYHIHDTDVVASVVAANEEDLSAPVTAIDMDSVAVEEKGKKEETEEESK